MLTAKALRWSGLLPQKGSREATDGQMHVLISRQGVQNVPQRYNLHTWVCSLIEDLFDDTQTVTAGGLTHNCGLMTHLLAVKAEESQLETTSTGTGFCGVSMRTLAIHWDIKNRPYCSVIPILLCKTLQVQHSCAFVCAETGLWVCILHRVAIHTGERSCPQLFAAARSH